MDLTDSLGNGMGGGEVLDFWGSLSSSPKSPFLNNELVLLYNLIPLVIAIIAALLIVIMIRVIMNMYNVRSLKKGKGIISELDYVNKLRKRDAKILRYNKLIRSITDIVNKSPFKTNKVNAEYLDYNLYRANIRIPGKSRTYKADEFNAVVVFITALIIAVWVVLTLVANYILGLSLIVFTVIMSSIMPMMVLRQTVKVKDDEIKANFADFYLMLHYVLIAKSKTPLASIMKSYAKTTNSDEMQRVVDTCTHYMDTYGEYEGTRYITQAYREIPSMGKLMRLIRQSNEGGDISSELAGFRQELLNEKKYAIEKRTDKLINRARASFNLLMPILIQAILSAMSIYLSDMGLISTFISLG